MAFYFKSSQIPELKPYTFTQRARIITQAQAYFTVPDKFILNIAKLIVLSPIFVMVARFEQWWMLIPMIIVGICYPLITNPIQLNLAKKYLPQALKVYQAEQASLQEENA
ncbi:DUF6170 family protein [Catenovulum sp. 2E275]|uniref:DUF6170 family protein n=1 Tax=Catenovulum sp. 2E275 TaxID=2980497 RepID=UPI0021CF6A85|nr:DUF6170 family protein [Catenovulum sp. 2E275]MCU4674968.1 DUF6170 family protein [Catenovulum sp. 2E275]